MGLVGNRVTVRQHRFQARELQPPLSSLTKEIKEERDALLERSWVPCVWKQARAAGAEVPHADSRAQLGRGLLVFCDSRAVENCAMKYVPLLAFFQRAG